MRRQSRIFAATVLWLLSVIAYFAFYYDEIFGFLTFLVGCFLILAGGVIAVLAAGRAIRRKSMIGFATVALVLAVGSVGWCTPIGRELGARCKFMREKSEYVSIIARISDGAEKPDPGHRVTVDDGPPLRVAFSWGGILDNWRGVVHDPTGEVMKANILDLKTWSNRDDPDYVSVAGLFGGTLIRAQHLEGDWYLCWFT